MSGTNSTPGAPPIDENSRSGLTLLLQAYTYAHDAGMDVWEFALEIDQLYEIGLTITDLRWLVAKKYVQHGQETSVYGDTHRSFRPSDGLNFTSTPEGAEFAKKIMVRTAA